jgi:hypothetical protein
MLDAGVGDASADDMRCSGRCNLAQSITSTKGGGQATGKGNDVGRRRGQSSIHCANASPLKKVGRADGLADGRAWPDCGLSSQISAVLCMGYHTKTSRRIETRRPKWLRWRAARIAPKVGRASSCESSRRQVGGSRQRLK